MSRHTVSLEDGRTLTVGWDCPFATFYAQAWPQGADTDWDPPSVAMGYHPTEAAAAGDTPGDGGPYPIPDADGLAELVQQRIGVQLAPRLQTLLTVDKALSR